MVYYSAEQVEKIAQELARTSLSGQRVSLSGYTSDITKRYGELMHEGSKSYRATTYKPSEREQRIAETKAISSAKAGTVLYTPGITGQAELQKEAAKKEEIKKTAQQLFGQDFGKVTQSKAPTKSDVFLGIQKVGGSSYRIYQDVNTGNKFIGGEAGGELYDLLKKQGVPAVSRIPTRSDTRIGTQEISGETYDVYQKESGEKFLAKKTQPEIFQKQIRTESIDGKKIPIIETYYRDEKGKVRKATEEERVYYESQTRTLKASQEKAPSQFIRTTGSVISSVGLPSLSGIWEEFKEASLPFFTPAMATENIRELSRDEQGREAAKSIFFGGIEGIYQKLSTSELKSPPSVLEYVSPSIGQGVTRVSLGQVYPLRVAAEFIPRTTAEALVLRYLPKLPSAARITFASVGSVVSAKTVLDINVPKEKRIAAGIIGLGAGAGAVFESMPYIKGGFARLSPKYAKVKTQPELFKAIELKETRIGLISEKSPLKMGITSDVKLPSISPLKRGGFGVTKGQKGLFLGEQQYLTTSQRGFFKKGLSIPIEREFFVTPQEPFIGIAETRISRLGLSDLFKFQGKTKLGLGIPKTPQIGLTITDVGRTETARGFKIGGTTELEAIKTFGTIKNIEKIGVTTLRGQYVQIFTYQIGEGGVVGKRVSISGISKTITPTVPITSLVSPISFKTQKITAETRTITATLKTPQISKTYVITGAYKPTGGITPSITTLKPSVTKPTLNVVLPSISLPSKKLARVSYFIKPSIKPSYYLPTPSRKPIGITRKKYQAIGFKQKLPKQKGSFSVFTRRFGKWKPLSVGVSLEKAFKIGTSYTGRTLGASFGIKKQTGSYRGKSIIPGYYSKLSKSFKGQIFIEKRGRRLKRGTLEIPEIQYYKKQKSKGGLY